ncbi:MAG: BMC domain-containing protein [Planctomycetota bacterium]|jgi:ethanolamine utilization protein EutM
MPPPSFALLEIGNLVPALVVADRAAKAAGVEIVGIESTMGAEQCIKLAGSAGDVREAGQTGVALARRMGTRADLVIMPGPTASTREVATRPPAFIPLLGIYDLIVKGNDPMPSSDALGLIETQGLVAALHATDEMLKASAVELVGKEKIGAVYVTILVRGDVAAVQAAVDAGRQTVERLDGKLIMADVITRPHPELAALLPA